LRDGQKCDGGGQSDRVVPEKRDAKALHLSRRLGIVRRMPAQNISRESKQSQLAVAVVASSRI
jgi:hypothetical protein